MIGRLRGCIVADEGDGSMVVEVVGVGYELATPLGTRGRLATNEDGEVTLCVHTHFREGAIELYGFSDAEERTAFRTLINIPKVGPKLAMAILGSLTVNELAETVQAGQLSTLTRVPGVGKKTAERMLLELDGKLTVTPGAAARSLPKARGGQAEVVVDALVRMGFKQAEAERAVSSLTDVSKPLSELIREALTLLSP